jgi:hypothetical protein
MDNSTTQSKWYDKTWLVIVLCIFFYALWKNQSISKGWKVGVTVVIALIVLAQIGKDKKGSSTSADNSSSSSSVQTEQKTEAPKGVGIGETLHTDYFDIIVNKVSLEDRVNTGNKFADLKPEQGNLYLIKNYQFDKAETIMLEGWGLLFDQINPLTTKTTNLVYKIPAEIKGPAYWQPGRAKKSQKIFLGNLE